MASNLVTLAKNLSNAVRDGNNSIQTQTTNEQSRDRQLERAEEKQSRQATEALKKQDEEAKKAKDSKDRRALNST